MNAVPLVEKLKSLTDLLFALVVVILGLILLFSKRGDRHERRGWGLEFIGVTIAALLGYLLHGFPLSTWLYRGLWCVLLAVMFEITRGAYLLLMPILKKNHVPSDTLLKRLRISELILYVASVIVILLGCDWFIYFYALYALIAACSLIERTFHHMPTNPRFWATVILIVLAAVCQGFKFIFSEYAVVAEHLFLIATICLLFDLIMNETT